MAPCSNVAMGNAHILILLSLSLFLSLYFFFPFWLFSAVFTRLSFSIMTVYICLCNGLHFFLSALKLMVTHIFPCNGIGVASFERQLIVKHSTETNAIYKLVKRLDHGSLFLLALLPPTNFSYHNPCVLTREGSLPQAPNTIV